MSLIDNLKNESPEQIEARLLEQTKANIRRNARARQEVSAEDHPPEPIPVARSLAERLSLPRMPVQWRIAKLLKRGHRVLLAAQYKAGKTTLVINLVRSLVDGVPFLGAYPVERVHRLTVLDFEMAEDEFNQLDEWYEAAKITHPDRVRIFPLRGRASTFNILLPDVRARWVEALRGTELLVVDCLRPILDAIGLDENLETGRFYVALDMLLTEAGIREAVVVQHMGHQHERARGSSRNLDWPDVNWTLVRETDNPASKRFIKAFGRGVDVPETAILFDQTTCRLTIGCGSRQDADAVAAVPSLLRFVAHETTPPNQSQIRKWLKENDGISDKTARKAIKLAISSGELIEKDGATNNSKVYEVSAASPF